MKKQKLIILSIITISLLILLDLLYYFNLLPHKSIRMNFLVLKHMLV